MQVVTLPYFDETLDVPLPDDWELSLCAPPALPALSDDEVRRCFANPIGTPRLRDIACGKKSAAVVVEDVTRPMRVDRLVPLVLEELEAAGIERDDIVIVSAVGCHRPQTGPDFRRKLGDYLVDHYRTLSPSQYDQLTYVGTTSQGTPIHINREVARAEVKIGVGGILPHPSAGFGGGGKTVLPGVCGFETVADHHLKGLGAGSGLGVVEGNGFRSDLEEAARLVGLDFVVNAVMGISRDITGLFVGDMIEAHRQGLEMVRRAYRVEAAEGADIAIISAFPEDYDLIQSTKALSQGMGKDSVRLGGRVLLIAACPDGAGFHSLYGPTGKGHAGFLERRKEQIAGRDVVIYSTGVGPKELLDVFPAAVKVFRQLDRAVAEVAAGIVKPRVNVFPYGAISMWSGGGARDGS